MKIVDVVTERFRNKTYERGPLHPFLDYEQPDPWLNQIVDRMDDEGYVHVSDRPGLGLHINSDYVGEHAIK